jgi:chemotaxis protein CheX
MSSAAAEPAMQLADVLALNAAAVLHADILARRGRDLVVDASEVGRLGGQCLQILLAAVVAWRADGARLTFANPSAAFIEALDLFGVAPGDRPHMELLA